MAAAAQRTGSRLSLQRWEWFRNAAARAPALTFAIISARKDKKPISRTSSWRPRLQPRTPVTMPRRRKMNKPHVVPPEYLNNWDSRTWYSHIEFPPPFPSNSSTVEAIATSVSVEQIGTNHTDHVASPYDASEQGQRITGPEGFTDMTSNVPVVTIRPPADEPLQRPQDHPQSRVHQRTLALVADHPDVLNRMCVRCRQDPEALALDHRKLYLDSREVTDHLLELAGLEEKKCGNESDSHIKWHVLYRLSSIITLMERMSDCDVLSDCDVYSPPSASEDQDPDSDMANTCFAQTRLLLMVEAESCIASFWDKFAALWATHETHSRIQANHFVGLLAKLSEVMELLKIEYELHKGSDSRKHFEQCSTWAQEARLSGNLNVPEGSYLPEDPCTSRLTCALEGTANPSRLSWAFIPQGEIDLPPPGESEPLQGLVPGVQVWYMFPEN
ncbi:uncharacterized protein MAM_06657 [Metarhizium album ARSEF 1941]|uniref:Uncharacterized protein n=1 Tax=Metarhizium album (strain ARSEF 1941) TaxID=1081103 RepID=A0A0B2WQY3_METAS|nr:uncharacterized protein MAM_06657 [Metarhizium album ARSEF 1941]KHN95380.1 hypothetical protein MAM_06657 [Metarhizium album ARSEF 1941]